ncbi:UNVERIFIED_CONTAM: hypothetical protein Slati_4292600 [Sesamum latifolium]|uniref:Endonuclease/exonuclease/phosphatase domain-containing protein n=1 Tax=Sesamum latifolium TaxID=2727402 RepID=A0AAW2TDK8_9LAMI
MINLAVWNVRGLNRRDHQVAVSDLISEFQLQFVGLLETRVSIRNVARIQSCLSHYWKWFVDYTGPGNRIWLAWKFDEVDVNVISVLPQIIHCSVLIRHTHISVLVSVVYGANDGVSVASCGNLWLT